MPNPKKPTHRAAAPKAATPKAPKKPAPKKNGRPSTYDKAVADEICERLSDGEPLRQICRDERMPPWRTVYSWMAANAELAAHIARARELGADAIAEQCLEIADETAFDTIDGPDGSLRANNEFIQRSRLRVETRLKLLAKWAPKKYGDKVGIDIDTPKGGVLEGVLTAIAGNALPVKPAPDDDE